jgi:hypothetical protein
VDFEFIGIFKIHLKGKIKKIKLTYNYIFKYEHGYRDLIRWDWFAILLIFTIMWEFFIQCNLLIIETFNKFLNDTEKYMFHVKQDLTLGTSHASHML